MSHPEESAKLTMLNREDFYPISSYCLATILKRLSRSSRREPKSRQKRRPKSGREAGVIAKPARASVELSREMPKLSMLRLVLLCKSNNANAHNQVVKNFATLAKIIALSSSEYNADQDKQFFFSASLQCLPCVLTDDQIPTISTLFAPSISTIIQTLCTYINQTLQEPLENEKPIGNDLELCLVSVHRLFSVSSDLSHAFVMSREDTLMAFETLLLLIRQTVKSYDRKIHTNPWILLASLSTLLKARDASADDLPLGCTCNINDTIKELLLFCFDDIPEDKADTQGSAPSFAAAKKITEELILYLIRAKPEECAKHGSFKTRQDSFLMDWSLNTISSLSQDKCISDSTYRIQLSLEYLASISTVGCAGKKKETLNIAKNQTRKKARPSKVKVTKIPSSQCRLLENKFLPSGALGNLLWLLVHQTVALRRSSFRLLCRLFGWSVNNEVRKKGGIPSLNLESDLKQSLIPILLCVNELCHERKYDPWFDEVCQLLNAVLNDIAKVVFGGGKKGDSENPVDQFLGTDDGEMMISACAGLLMLLARENQLDSCAQGSNLDMLKSMCLCITDKVINLLSRVDIDITEEARMFWETINMLSQNRLTNTEEPEQARLENDGDLQPLLIIFRTDQNGFNLNTRMECPPLQILCQLAPQLANQVTLSIARLDGIPVVCGHSYQAMEKMLDDISSYEPFTRQQIIDDIHNIGDDDLCIEECIELLKLAHEYGAAELQTKYSTLCSTKISPDNSLFVLRCSLSVDDVYLSTKAFEIVRANFISLVRNAEVSELSQTLTSFIWTMCINSK